MAADPGDTLQGISEQAGINLGRLSYYNEGLSDQTLAEGEELHLGDYDSFQATRGDVASNQAQAGPAQESINVDDPSRASGLRSSG